MLPVLTRIGPARAKRFGVAFEKIKASANRERLAAAGARLSCCRLAVLCGFPHESRNMFAVGGAPHYSRNVRGTPVPRSAFAVENYFHFWVSCRGFQTGVKLHRIAIDVCPHARVRSGMDETAPARVFPVLQSLASSVEFE